MELSDISSDEEFLNHELHLSDISSNEDFLNEEHLSDISSNEDFLNEDWDVVDDEQLGMGDGFVATDFYELGEETTTFIRRFNMEGRSVPLLFKNLNAMEDAHYALVKTFEDVIPRLLDEMNVQATDRIGVQVTHPSLDKPIIAPFIPASEMTGDFIVQWIEKVLQSHEEITLDELRVNVVVVHAPVGSGDAHRRRVHTNWRKWYDSHACKGGCFIAYCESDVDILRRCCLEYRRLFMDDTGIDPFKQVHLTINSRSKQQTISMSEKLNSQILPNIQLYFIGALANYPKR